MLLPRRNKTHYLCKTCKTFTQTKHTSRSAAYVNLIGMMIGERDQ